MFEKAARSKFRFKSPKGLLSVEDLWDLNLDSLDKIAIDLSEEIDKSGKKSFIKEKTTENSLLSSKFELVKYIIDTKLTEKDARILESAKAEKKRTILALIQAKKEQELGGKSIEELEQELNKL